MYHNRYQISIDKTPPIKILSPKQIEAESDEVMIVSIKSCTETTLSHPFMLERVSLYNPETV